MYPVRYGVRECQRKTQVSNAQKKVSPPRAVGGSQRNSQGA